jgi:predicted adenine nucleotide alpha hydrolase (AANH) superfamily ATPase
MPVIFFYNPNIHPLQEYLLRKASVAAYAQKMALEVIDGDYDPEYWMSAVKGLESEPERGRRCAKCFDVRLGRTAQYAHDHGFKCFATTNGIGRWKDLKQVNASGHRAAARYPGLTFLDRNWRENDALAKASGISKAEGFFRQTYCGCIYSRKILHK